MDGHFAQQLANLQRAASRAGRDDAGRGAGGRSSGGGGGGEARTGGRDGRRGDYREHHRDGNRGPPGSSRDYGSGRDGGGGHDGGRRNDYNNPRKRDRDERGNHNNHGRGRGRFGGRGNYTNNNGGRGGRLFEGRGRDGHGDQPPLAELVDKVAAKYKSSNTEDDEKPTSNKNSATTNIKQRRHIALLFLTIDNLPHEHIWKEWLKSSSASSSIIHSSMDGDNSDEKNGSAAKSNNDGGPSSRDNDDEGVLVSVICHAKYPERIKSPWLRQRHLLQRHYNNSPNKEGNTKTDDGDRNNSPRFHSRRPEWGSIEITRAMIDLLEEGLRIGNGGGIDGEKKDGDLYHKYLSTPFGDAASSDGATIAGTTTLIPPVDRFVFVSESCLPVATLKEMELALFGPRETSLNNQQILQQGQQAKPPTKNVESLYNKSWVNARSTPNNGYARQLQWDAIRPTDIPSNHVWKADQWLVLTRQHGQAIASLPNIHFEGRHLWPALRKCRASDEMYFPTALSILGILHRPPGASEVDDNTTALKNNKESCAGSGIRRRRITYCDWSMGAKNPASFTNLEWKDVVDKARGEGCLFARKFVSKSSLPAMRGGGRKKIAAGGSSSADDGDGLVSVEAWTSAVVRSGS